MKEPEKYNIVSKENGEGFLIPQNPYERYYVIYKEYPRIKRLNPDWLAFAQKNKGINIPCDLKSFKGMKEVKREEVEIKEQLQDPSSGLWLPFRKGWHAHNYHEIGVGTRQVAVYKPLEKSGWDSDVLVEKIFSKEPIQEEEPEFKKDSLVTLKLRRDGLIDKIKVLEQRLKEVNNKIYWIENPHGDF